MKLTSNLATLELDQIVQIIRCRKQIVVAKMSRLEKQKI